MQEQSHVPDAIRAEGEKAKKLLEELAARKSGEAGKTGEETPPEQAPDGTDFEQKAEATEVPAREPDTQEKPKGEDWEQKYRVLQGKYNADTVQLREQIKALAADLEALKSRPQKEEEAPKKGPQKVDPGNLADFGDDMVKMAESVNLLSDEVERLRAENNDLRGQMEPIKKDVQASSTDRFLGQLAGLVPWYSEQNVDPEFVAWLAEADPLDPEERSRQDRLTAAAQKGNAKVVANYFLTWNMQTGRYGEKAEPVAPETPKKAPANIQPGASRASEAPAGKKMWSAAEVDKFYRELREGRYAGQDAKVMSIKQDIAAAYREGRLR